MTTPTKVKVYGTSGVSRDSYDYVLCSYIQAIEIELEQGKVLADVHSGFTCLTQYDPKSCKVIGKKRVINVFVEGNLPDFPDFSNYNPAKSGIYTFPKSLTKTLQESFKDVIFITGKSVNSIVKAEDKVKRVAYKILKRKLFRNKVKSAMYKVAVKLGPMVASAVALSV